MKELSDKIKEYRQLEARLQNLKRNNNFNNNYNNNNNFGGRLTGSLPRSPPPPTSAGNSTLRGNSTRRPVVGVIPRVSEEEPSVPELPPEDQIRLSPTLRRTFPEQSDEEDENEPPQPVFTIPNFDKIRNTLNDSKMPPELEFFNGGKNLRFEQIINNLGINQDSRDF